MKSERRSKIIELIGKYPIETQEELAEMSDMTTQAVSYAESGKRAMRPDSLRKLAAALCVSADYLLDLTDSLSPYSK